MKKKYRIVIDGYLGYEVQVWRWYWPFWVMVGGCNTFSTYERAERYMKYVANKPTFDSKGNPL